MLALFPLRVVLFPRTDLPLHIFEERYKLMIGELLEGSREFGVVLTLENGIASVGCTTRIGEVTKRYEDGRMDIQTTGYRRFEIDTLDEELSFLRGKVDFFEDEHDTDPVAETVVHRAISGYFAMKTFASGSELPEPRLNDPQLSFQLAQAVTDINFRQTLLMSRSESERIRRLAEYFPLSAAKQRRIEHIRTLAPKNGHARLLPGQ